jgi:hypothetical protein
LEIANSNPPAVERRADLASTIFSGNVADGTFEPVGKTKPTKKPKTKKAKSA